MTTHSMKGTAMVGYNVQTVVDEPERVQVHDFVDAELGRANPYGVYDIGADEGWVSVGTDHDTSAIAVQTIRRW